LEIPEPADSPIPLKPVPAEPAAPAAPEKPPPPSGSGPHEV